MLVFFFFSLITAVLSYNWFGLIPTLFRLSVMYNYVFCGVAVVVVKPVMVYSCIRETGGLDPLIQICIGWLGVL